MKKLLLWLALLVTTAHAAAAQEVVLGDQTTSPPAGAWPSQCVAASRADTLDCSVSERAIAQGTGQLIGSVVVRAGGGTPAQMIVTGPLGLYIPGGLSIDIDGSATQRVDLEACDRAGCYGTIALSDDLLAAMRHGKVLDVVFQNTAKQPGKLPLPLAGFGDAFDKIK